MSACLSAQLSDINHIHVCMIITSLPVSETLIPDWITFLPLPTVVSCAPVDQYSLHISQKQNRLHFTFGSFHSVNPRLIYIVRSKRTQFF